MAGKPLQILIDIQSRVGPVVSDLEKVGRAFQGVRGAFFGLSEVGRSLQTLGLGITVLGLATTAAIVKMVDSAADLDDAMVKVAAIASSGSIDVDDLRESFLQMSNELPISAAALGEVAVNAARAGIHTQREVERMSLLATKLATVSGEMSEVAASDDLIKIANGFRRAGEGSEALLVRVERLADALSAVSLAGPGTVKQLGNIMRRASAGAKLIGVTERELAALSGTILALGSTPEVAGTALSNFFTKMSQDVDKFAGAAGITTDELKKLINEGKGMEAVSAVFAGVAIDIEKFTKETGKSREEIESALKGAGDADSVRAVLEGMGASAKSATDLAAAFKELGIRGARSGRVLLGLGQNLTELAKFQRAAADSAGSMHAVYTKFIESFKQRLKTLMGSIENIAISFGTVLLPILNQIIDVLLVVISAINAIPVPVKLAIVLFTILAAVVLLTTGALIFLTGTLIIFAAAAAFVSLGITRLVMANKRAVVSIRKKTRAIWKNMKRLKFWRHQIRKTRRALKGLGRSALGAMGGLTRFSTVGGTLRALKNDLMVFMAAPLATIATQLARIPVIGAVLAPAFSAISAAIWPIALAVAASVAFMLLFRKEINNTFGALIEMTKAFFGMFSQMGRAVSEVFEADGLGGGLVTALKWMVFFFMPFLQPLIMGLLLLPPIMRTIGAVFKGVGSVMAAILVPIFKPISRIARAFKELGLRLRDWAVAFLGLKEGTDIFELIAKGVERLLSPLIFIGKWIGFLLEVVLGALFGVFEGFLVGFMEPFMDTLGELGAVLSELWTAVVDAFSPVISAFGELLDALNTGEDGFDLMGVVIQGMSFLIQASLFFIIIPLKFLLKLFVMVVSVMAGVAKAFLFVTRVALWPMQKAFEFLAWLFGKASGGAKAVSSTIKQAFVSMSDAITSAIQPVLDALQWLIDAPGKIVRGIGTLAGLGSSGGGTGGIAATATSVGTSALATVIPGLGFLPLLAKLTGNARGGITTGSGLVKIHPEEAIIPLNKLPEVVSRMPRGTSAPASSSIGGAGGGGAPASLSLTIPVQVVLDGSVLGDVLVRVSDEQIRQQLGTRNVRLAGI